MQHQWRIRVRGQQRKQIDTELLVQAVIALGRQLWDESQASATGAANSASDEAATPEQQSEAS